MTAKATRKPPVKDPVIDIRTLERFTPEQVEELKLSPYTAATLRKKAQRREIHHHRDGMKITFTRDDLQRNADLGATAPLAIGA
ncbi:hypothetical protein NMG29_06440 [Streptomyces cocklensis]|uniref:Helix-turn-helix domain-containing protein n=1 Tax=Actinacidiphila cocklensis TaxID=887465 RepID=A0A9W4GPP8_9ACTN|nr:hypothetical protein [Actinacidiphila cocklensis]MDD1057869.1 hypothetical protein [Actinacidiphila cocklensis]CAG6392730.1 conserved hypothetical protein [Actinacidiphila cocklensis]